MKHLKRKAYSVLWLLVVLSLLTAIPVSASASTNYSEYFGLKDKNEESYYVIGASEDTFAGLYKKMCVNLDLKKYPIPEPEEDGSIYGTGDYERITVLKDDAETYETIGYVYSPKDKPLYIIRSWIGYHEEGVVIRMQVYYSLEGTYIGNIKFDLTNGLSNSSTRVPYYIPSEGTHNLK